MRCQISPLPAHNPTVSMDPRAHTQLQTVHTQYRYRYCRLCTPSPQSWDPYLLPGPDTPIGNELHTLFQCPNTLRHSNTYDHDMVTLMNTFSAKVPRAQRDIPQWQTLTQEEKLRLTLGSIPPPNWKLSLYRAKLYIHMSEPAIKKFLSAIFQQIHQATLP